MKIISCGQKLCLPCRGGIHGSCITIHEDNPQENFVKEATTWAKEQKGVLFTKNSTDSVNYYQICLSGLGGERINLIEDLKNKLRNYRGYRDLGKPPQFVDTQKIMTVDEYREQQLHEVAGRPQKKQTVKV